MNDELNAIFEAIKAEPQNAEYTKQGIDPLYYVDANATILVIGQAPGKKAQDTHIIWNDASGKRLREWMGVSDDTFYHSGKIAVLPCDFYFPGKGKSGDLPPRKGFADKWHPRLLKAMPNLQLTMLVGNYALRKYLDLKSKDTLTNTVKHFRDYLPEYFPLVHPSPRNQMWMKKNPWFEAEVLPELKRRVQDALK